MTVQILITNDFIASFFPQARVRFVRTRPCGSA